MSDEIETRAIALGLLARAFETDAPDCRTIRFRLSRGDAVFLANHTLCSGLTADEIEASGLTVEQFTRSLLALGCVNG